MSIEDTEDFELLSLANDKHKFGIELGSAASQPALERGIDQQWFTLVDLSAISVHPGRLFRIFRLTEAGIARLAELRKRKLT